MFFNAKTIGFPICAKMLKWFFPMCKGLRGAKNRATKYKYHDVVDAANFLISGLCPKIIFVIVGNYCCWVDYCAICTWFEVARCHTVLSGILYPHIVKIIEKFSSFSINSHE